MAPSDFVKPYSKSENHLNIHRKLTFWSTLNLLILACFLGSISFFKLPSNPLQKHYHPNFSAVPKLQILTLNVNRPGDSPFVEHNCAVISRTRHSFNIYTDNVTQPACAKCNCIKFVPTNCRCADVKTNLRDGVGKCFLCEKLNFYTAQLKLRRELVFLDADLILLRDDVLDKLAVRTSVHDFLASYAQGNRNVTNFYERINSGFFFMRWLPGIDYSEINKIMYTSKTKSDQRCLSAFVKRRYRNWDTLSYRWHCRFLQAGGYSIPWKECYTHHDDAERNMFLKAINFTLETV